MSRKAIIIEASKLKNHSDLPGARMDAENYCAYLLSDFGGAWDAREIMKMSHPTKRQLMQEIEGAKYLDYCFVAFSGHGHHVQGREIDETRICINDAEEASVNELNPGNPHCLIVADCCRNVTVLEEETRTLKFALNKAMASRGTNSARCRTLFDEAVGAAERGAIFMYSCNLNEAAGESNRGGFFSRALVNVGEQWGERQVQRSVLRSDSAFRDAAAITTRRNPQQSPQHSPGRRMVHMPLAVYAS